MVFNPNSYNYSNDLSRIANSLGKAMFGSAADDAAIARRKYYDSQTEGQNLKNRGMSGNLDAIDAAAQGNIMSKSIANALGYDLDNGNLIQPVLPGGDQKSVPALGADQRNMDGGALMTELGNIGRTMYGDGTSNANQLSQMLNNLGSAGASRLAESMILGGTDDQAGRGALLMSPSGGQFQNPGFAAQKLRTEDATNRRDDDLDQAADMNEDRVRFGVGGQGDRDTEAQEATKADNNKRDQETVRYKHDNRTINLKVEPGKQIVVDPTTAEKLGIPVINDPSSPYNGLHVLDGGQKPGDVVVKVGREDVFMDETTAEAIGAERNEDGQYVIKGAGYKEDASTRGDGNTSFAVTPSDDTALKEMTVTADTDKALASMSNGGFIQDLLVKGAIAEMGPKKNISKGKNYIRRMLAQGFTEVTVPDNDTIMGVNVNTDIKFPNFLVAQFNGTTGVKEDDERIKNTPIARRQQLAIQISKSLGYNDAEAAAIAANLVK